MTGGPLGKEAIRAAWKRACLRTGFAIKDPVTKKVKMLKPVHDLRRTATRDFRQAGVSEGEIMALAGWETRSMFDRYNVIDEADLAQAVARRFSNGIEQAKQPPVEESSPSLTSGATP